MPNPSNSRGAKRVLIVLALAVAFLAIAPAVSSVIIISTAWSDRSDVKAQRHGGLTVVRKNGETPDWMAQILEQSPTDEAGVAGPEIDPKKGLAI